MGQNIPGEIFIFSFILQLNSSKNSVMSIFKISPCQTPSVTSTPGLEAKSSGVSSELTYWPAFWAPCFFASPAPNSFLHAADRMIFEPEQHIIWLLSSKPSDDSSVVLLSCSVQSQNKIQSPCQVLHWPISFYLKLSPKAGHLLLLKFTWLILASKSLYLLCWHYINSMYSFKFLTYHVGDLVFHI